LEKVLKTYTAYQLAVVMEQDELPEKPDWFEDLSAFRYVFRSRSWVNFCRYAALSGKGVTKHVTFFYNFYQGKAGSLAPSYQMIEQALVKHKNILCVPKPNPFEDLDCDDKVFHKLMDNSITRAVEEIFGRKPRKIEAAPPSRIGSLGASYSGPRYSGGAMGDICYQVEGDREIKISKDTFLHRFSGEKVFLGFATHPSRDYLVEPVYGSCDPDDYDWAEEQALHMSMSGRADHPYTRGWPRPIVRHHCLKSLTDAVWWAREEIADIICNPDWDAEEKHWGRDADSVQAEVVPLLEAFKVRTITKGNYAKYHLARRWQAVIHKKMRKHPSCQLIGKPCTKEVLSETVMDPSKWVQSTPKSFFVSGDYESATDLLNPWLSSKAQAEIGRVLGIPFEHQVILNECLTKHKLDYPESSGIESARQCWGQLMGSPTSFPVLCLSTWQPPGPLTRFGLERCSNFVTCLWW